MSREYEYQASLDCTGFSLEIELIAEYDYRPGCKGSLDEYGQQNEPDTEEEIKVTLIRSGVPFPNPFHLEIAKKLDEQEDKSQLENAISEDS